MVLFNYSTKELTAKVVYYGPGLCGKTTNLQWIHEKTPIKNKGKMLSLATEADRTLFFDFLPIDLGTIRGMKTRIQLYTVPGQVFYNATRRMVLKGADCVVFVADSQEPMLDANLDALANLKENLEANEIDADEIPTVLQYNKRDLPNALPVEILNERLNGRGLLFYEAVAMKGQGVDETLKAATGLVFKSLATKYGGGGDAASRAAAAAPSAAAPRPLAAASAAAPAPSPRPPAPAPSRPAPLAGPNAMAAPRSVPVRAAAAPAVVAPADELLESIDLQPHDGTDESLELSLGSGNEIETVSMDELSLEAPAPPGPLSGAASGPGKTTIVRTQSEADDLRQRIGRPTDPELTLDAMDPDDEDIEEISFDTAPNLVPETSAPEPAPVRPAPAPPPPAPRAAPPAPPLRPPVAGAPVPPAAPRTLPPMRAPALPSVAAPSSPLPPRAPGPSENTAPIRVSATVRSGEAALAIPVEVTIRDGQGQVEIQLRIVLDLKIGS